MKSPICKKCKEPIDRSAGGYLIGTFKDSATSETIEDKRFYLHDACVPEKMKDYMYFD